MKAVINQSTIHFTYKNSELDRVEEIINTMCSEINSICIMELYDKEATLCYSSDEITVTDVKKCYSDAKKATR